MQHCCSECDYLTRTSPAQVFLLCGFWSAKNLPVSGTSWDFDRDYVIRHCHMQPEAPACPFFKPKPKKVSNGADGDTGELLCTG